MSDCYVTLCYIILLIIHYLIVSVFFLFTVINNKGKIDWVYELLGCPLSGLCNSVI